MNTNSTEIKNEISGTNQSGMVAGSGQGGMAGPGGTGDPSVAAGNLPGAAPSSLNPCSDQSKACEAPQPVSPTHPLTDSLTHSLPPPLLFPPNKRPRTGKVAQLPDELRHFVSQQIYDEVSFTEIIDALADQGHTGFNKPNLTAWKLGGYRDWLIQEEHRLSKEARQDHVIKMIRSKGSLDDVVLSVALNQIFEVLDAFEVKLLQRRLSTNPQMYPVVVQSMLSLVKARKASSTPPPLRLGVKPSPGDPDFVLPEAERGLSDETIKKMIEAINLM